VSGMSEGGSSVPVNLESKPGMGVGHCWGWEAADKSEGDSLKVVECLEELALATLMVAVCWECNAGHR
jgi:hypothetical protein